MISYSGLSLEKFKSSLTNKSLFQKHQLCVLKRNFIKCFIITNKNRTRPYFICFFSEEVTDDEAEQSLEGPQENGKFT